MFHLLGSYPAIFFSVNFLSVHRNNDGIDNQPLVQDRMSNRFERPQYLDRPLFGKVLKISLHHRQLPHPSQKAMITASNHQYLPFSLNDRRRHQDVPINHLLFSAGIGPRIARLPRQAGRTRGTEGTDRVSRETDGCTQFHKGLVKIPAMICGKNLLRLFPKELLSL